ncbi:MAG: hypothetical protein H0T42_25340 [Deltaproteobacteria bacterium]|nr:hypothetical protein [Deltaproteobacteria bacterium]
MAIMAFPQPVTAPKSGYVVTEISGAAAPGIFASTTTSSLTPGIESMQALPQTATGTTPKVFTFPHVLEQTGKIASTTNTFDTTFHMTYTGGLPGTPAGAGATVDLYLFGETGGAMTNNGATVCAPCSFPLASTTAAARKQSVSIDDLITAQGGTFDTQIKLGFGVFVVRGADPENVNLQGFVVNSHASAFDLSVFGFEPQPIAAGAP